MPGGSFDRKARHCSLTYIVNAERALFAGDLLSTAVRSGAISAMVMAVVGLWIGTRAMLRAGA